MCGSGLCGCEIKIVQVKILILCQHSLSQGQTGPPGCLVLARWAGWSAGQVDRNVSGRVSTAPALPLLDPACAQTIKKTTHSYFKLALFLVFRVLEVRSQGQMGGLGVE